MNDATGPQLLAVTALLVAVLIFATAKFRGIWSGANLDRLRANLSWWPYSRMALEGWIRALPVGLVGAYAVALGSFALALIRLGVADPYRDWMVRLIVVSLVAAPFAVLVMLLIIAFNVPRFLVPPPLRNQEGLVTAWWRRRRDGGQQSRPSRGR